ncbi:MAG: polymer-forming cytoskeletal protein [Thermodesulfobacteriota bacterium]
MTIFNKKDDLEQKIKSGDSEAISSIIDTNMLMKGELSFEGKAKIDGAIEGNIKGDHLILSEDGKITGDVEVITFVCHGTLEGNVKADLVTAKKSCRIQGCLEGRSLSVEPGAALNGEMKISTRELHLVDDKESTQIASG